MIHECFKIFIIFIFEKKKNKEIGNKGNHIRKIKMCLLINLYLFSVDFTCLTTFSASWSALHIM